MIMITTTDIMITYNNIDNDNGDISDQYCHNLKIIFSFADFLQNYLSAKAKVLSSNIPDQQRQVLKQRLVKTETSIHLIWDFLDNTE